MTIPFVRGFPNGTCRVQEIQRTPEIEAAAHRFIWSGGMYFCEALKDGSINLFAVKVVVDDPIEIASRCAENGPGLLDAIDSLVRETDVTSH